MSKTRIGFALTGSFCTFSRVFDVMETLTKMGYDLFPVLSFASAREDTRFFTSKEVWERLKKITGHLPIATLPEAEPIGPKKMFDAYVIAPMSGVSMAKFANGIFDTPVLLGAKSHLRNDRPVLIAPSTNDGLSTAAANIGKILGMRNVYFVPFGQDDPIAKPRSVVAAFEKIPDALAAALAGGQMQPILLGSLKKEGK